MLPFKRRLMAGLVKPIRSKAYLDWVKTLSCCGCGIEPASDGFSVNTMDAHHLIAAGLGGGMGTKASDLLTIPLCRKCHNELHRDVKDWETENGSQYKHICLTLLEAVDEGIIEL
jgi:hypothetical protein